MSHTGTYSNNMEQFKKGMKVGIPISLGYFAVSITLGIAAKNAGLTPFQAMLASILNNASAGEFAGFTVIAAGGGYLTIAIMTLIANARYFLMSCALSQKLPENTSLLHRMLIGFDIADEIFGVSISVPGKLNPFFTYGVIAVAAPGWAIGTYLGVVLGNILPLRVVSALSVGLYGMFIAVIVPPAKKNKVVAGLITLVFVFGFIMEYVPAFDFIPGGIRVILLTVLISGAAAVLFPVKESDYAE